MPNKKFIFESEVASVEVAAGPIEFAGRTFTPDRAKAFVRAKLCHTFPTVNTNGRTVTAATMANSFQSAEFQLVDFEHQLRVFAPEKIFRDKIVGSIAAIQFPSKEEAVALAAAGTPVALEVLYAVWRNAEKVSDFLVDVGSDKGSWKSSFELARDTATDALVFLDDGKFVPVTEADAEMAKCVEPFNVKAFGERQMALALGGEDGMVVFTGAGLTRNPADKSATIEGVTASDREWRLEAASITPPEDKHKTFIIGWQNEEATEVAKPAEEPPKEPVQKPKSQAAKHTPFFEEVVAMDAKLASKVVAMFEQMAAASEDKEQTKAFLALAQEIKADSTTASVEDAVKEKVAAGELIPKADHEAKVKEAADAALAAYQTSIKEAEEAVKARIETVKKAGLDPAMKIGANDKTIASVMGAFPLGEDGDAQLATKILDWQFIKEHTAKATETASGQPAPIVNPTGGSGSVQSANLADLI